MNKRTLIIFAEILLLVIFLSPHLAANQAMRPEGEFEPTRHFNFDYIVLFSDDVDKSQLRIFVSVVYDELTFFKVGDEFRAEYYLNLSVLKNKTDFVDSRRSERTVTVDNYFRTNSRELFDLVETDFDLPPGEYRMVIELTDQGSHEPTRTEEKVSIPGREKSPLLFSGPILLDSVVVNENGLIEFRPGISGNVFEGAKSIWVYFELLAENYPITVDFSYNFLNSKGESKISGKFVRELQTAVLRDRFILDIKEFPFDDYQLIITAKSGNDIARAVKKFRIHWPELPPYIHDLELAINQLRYLTTERDIARINENYLGRRLEFFLEFWSKWGENENQSYCLMEEYYRRLSEANQLFGPQGWRTDRGHVYAIFGPPSEIDRHPFDMQYEAYEIWYYFETNRRFVFVDEGGFGDYKLKSPFWGN